MKPWSFMSSFCSTEWTILTGLPFPWISPWSLTAEYSTTAALFKTCMKCLWQETVSVKLQFNLNLLLIHMIAWDFLLYKNWKCTNICKTLVKSSHLQCLRKFNCVSWCSSGTFADTMVTDTILYQNCKDQNIWSWEKMADSILKLISSFENYCASDH